MTLVFQAVPLGGEYCDFCRSHSIFKVYKCSNFECCGRPVFASAPTGSWASCGTCSELMESSGISQHRERFTGFWLDTK